MSKVLSSTFGAINYEPGELFIFDHGLPGFPNETMFLPVQIPDQFPLVYLQSLRTQELCFAALPAKCLVADYELRASPEDLNSIALGPDAQPGIGVLCLALICFGENGSVEANLRAPVVINVESRRGVQAVQGDDRYPIRYPVEVKDEAALC
jgi:flagellar assembly factor FliW